jgi:hypothetical protein
VEQLINGHLKKLPQRGRKGALATHVIGKQLALWLANVVRLLVLNIRLYFYKADGMLYAKELLSAFSYSSGSLLFDFFCHAMVCEHVKFGGDTEDEGLFQGRAECVGMGVDEAGKQRAISSIDYLGIRRALDVATNYCNSAILYEDGTLRKYIGAIEDASVLNGEELRHGLSPFLSTKRAPKVCSRGRRSA